MSAAQASALAAPDLTTYKPAFFTDAEWKFVVAACDRLIPADEEGPGALETNVPVFIDQQLNAWYGDNGRMYMQGPFQPDASPLFGYQLPYTMRDLYRRGIAAVQAYCRQQHGQQFEALDAAARDQVLTQLEKDQIDFGKFGESVLKSRVFFSHLLGNTKEGYLADPMYGGNKGMGAWKMIGFPGARASFLEWVGQHNVKYPLGPVSLLGERG